MFKLHGLTIEETLETAVRIETRAADLYGVLARRFSHVPGMTGFWEDLRHDELGHANTLRSVRGSLSKEKLASTVEHSITASVNGIMEMMGKDLLGQIKTLDDAYEIANELEFSEINALFKYLTTDIVTTASRGEIIVHHIDEHQQKLIDFDKHYGNKEWRSQFKIQPE